MLYDIVYGRDSDSDSECESYDYKEELLKNELGVDSFTSEFVNSINVTTVLFILFGYAYSYFLWKFVVTICYASFWAVHYLAILVWDSLDKGEEWLQLAVIVLTFVIGGYVLKSANDMDDRIENYIMKLKAELAEKDVIILKLSEQLNSEQLNSEQLKASDKESDI